MTAWILWVCTKCPLDHDEVIKWKHFPRYWSFVRGIHRSPVNSPHKGQWRIALMFSLICVWINDWINNGEAGDLRRHRGYYDVTVMYYNRARWKMVMGYLQFNSSARRHVSAMASQITDNSTICSTVFKLTSKKTPELCIIGPLWGKMAGGFPHKGTSSCGKVFHAVSFSCMITFTHNLSDAIWKRKYWSTIARIMACYLR